MPKTYRSLFYTIQIMAVIITDTLTRALIFQTDKSSSGTYSLSIVLGLFLCVMIFNSRKLIETPQQHLVLWGGTLLSLLGVFLVIFITSKLGLERYSLVFDLGIAFGINHIGYKMLT